MTLKDAANVYTWHTANTFLGNKNEKKIANNTTVHRDHLSQDIIVRYHSTDIIRYAGPDNPNYGSVKLNTGGYHTTTTKYRMNIMTRVKIYQKNWEWYIYEQPITYPDVWDTEPYAYSDGLWWRNEVAPDGNTPLGILDPNDRVKTQVI